MGIYPNHFNNYLLKQPIKVMYLVVNFRGIDVTTGYQINKPSANTKSTIICVIKIDTGVSHKFTSVCFFFYKKKKKRNY